MILDIEIIRESLSNLFGAMVALLCITITVENVFRKSLLGSLLDYGWINTMAKIMFLISLNSLLLTSVRL